VASEAGLRYEWKISSNRPLNILQTIGNGCAFLDYDQDGNLDILLVGPRPALFRGDGQGHFQNVTQKTGLDRLAGHFLGCCVGDIDNDGYPDLYLSGYREGRLLHNVGSGAGSRGFRDITAVSGLKPQPWGTSCGFADLDGDGYLDLYVCNYVDFGPHTRQLCQLGAPQGVVTTSCGPRDYRGIQGTLYRNCGGRRFEDVTYRWGADAHSGKGLGVAFADFDGSGRPGFAVANDEVAGDLFRNEGRGRLTNIGAASGTAFGPTGQPQAGMGVDWGDFDNDGKLDLFVATFSNEVKSLYHNQGNALFVNVGYESGISRPAHHRVAFGAKFFDADNDGWLDLMIANGHVQDNVAAFRFIDHSAYRQTTQLFRNLGPSSGSPRRAPTQFVEIGAEAGEAFRRALVGRGLAVGDYDNDGRVDALVVDSEGAPLLLHNQSASDNSWIGFQLVGRGRSNRSAYGAVITVTAGARRYARQCQPAGSYLSSSDPRVHFGLGKGEVTGVTVRWPDGRTTRYGRFQTGRYWLLRQP
jgi:hypothetical protein